MFTNDILIFIDSLWNNHILIFQICVSEKWAKMEKLIKLIEKNHKFDLPYGFCSHFHIFCPFWLTFYIKCYDMHRFFCILLTNFQNCLENVCFCFKVNQDKNPLKHETFTLRCQKYFFKAFWVVVQRLLNNYGKTLCTLCYFM